MKQTFVIPAKGMNIRDPETMEPIPAEGAFRMLNTYYNRRIRSGDLLVREDMIEKTPDAPAADKPADSGSTQNKPKETKGVK